MSKDFRFSLRSTDRAQAERPEAAHIKAASGRRKEMLREEVFQKATDGRPYSCFAEHYGQEYSECDAGKERAKQIAGERRYRAAQMAGLETIPAYVRTVEDETLMEMALIENIQREDLNSIEIALAFQKLIELYQLTQEKLSERVGKKRTTIANYLRLLKLPAEVQIGLRDKRIDMGHARALLSVADPALQLELYERILSDGLSVRSVEDLAKTLSAGGERARKKAQKKVMMRQEYNVLKSHLSDFFNAKVQFTCDEKGKGKISIPFKNEEDLERIIGLFDKLK